MRRQKVIIYRSDAFKMAIVREYQASRVSKNALCRKYGIGSPHAISDWIRIFAFKIKEEYMREQSIEHQEIRELNR
jgi:transposase-like protein